MRWAYSTMIPEMGPETHTGPLFGQTAAQHSTLVYATEMFILTYLLTYYRLGRSPKVNAWILLRQNLLQAGCPSCHPTNSIKALKDE